MLPEPHTPLHHDQPSGAGGWPVLLPSAIDMTPPDSYLRNKRGAMTNAHMSNLQGTPGQLSLGNAMNMNAGSFPSSIPVANVAPQQPVYSQMYQSSVQDRRDDTRASQALASAQWTQAPAPTFATPLSQPRMSLNDAAAMRQDSGYLASPLAGMNQGFGQALLQGSALHPGQRQLQPQYQQQNVPLKWQQETFRTIQGSPLATYNDSANNRLSAPTWTNPSVPGPQKQQQQQQQQQTQQHFYRAPPAIQVQPPSVLLEQHQPATITGKPSFDTKLDSETGESAKLGAGAGNFIRYQEYKAYLSRQKREPNTKEAVWSKEVEGAFMEGLQLIPRVGRRKITVDGRHRGRNELIADYIYMKTKQQRTRKQVSSHIQVLKHIFADDKMFMDLVSDVADSTEDYDNINATTFEEFIERLEKERMSKSKPQEQAVKRKMSNADLPSAKRQPSVSQQPPQRPPSAPLTGRLAAAGPAIEPNSPGLDRRFKFGQGAGSNAAAPSNTAAPWFESQLATPPQLSRRGMHRRQVSQNVDLGADKVSPVSFRLVTQGNNGRQTLHSYTRLMRPQLESPLRAHAFDRIAQRFPILADLKASGEINEQTPVIHGLVKLDVGNHPDPKPRPELDSTPPTAKDGAAHAPSSGGFSGATLSGSGSSTNSPPSASPEFAADVQFLVWGTASSQLLASPARGNVNTPSVQRVPTHMWECETTVVSVGRTLLRMRDVVTVREELLQGVERLYVPFAPDFWAPFFASFEKAENAKSAAPRNPNAAIAAITVTQVIRLVPTNSRETSVAFVLVYEFERATDAFSARTVFRRVGERPVGIDASPLAKHADSRTSQSSQQPTQQLQPAPQLNLASSQRLGHTRLPSISSPSWKLTRGLSATPNSRNLSLSPMVRLDALDAVQGFGRPLQSLDPSSNTGSHGPLSARDPPTDFLAFSMMEGERIQRSMTAFEVPQAWQEPELNDWCVFE